MQFRLRAQICALVAFSLFNSAFSFAPCVNAQTTNNNQQQQHLPSGVQRLSSVEGINEYQLANGLKVLLFPDQTKQNITVNITYLVGSRHENYGETGMAHLLEHLVFKGTPKHPNIPAELTAHGASPNGTTSFDRTNYFETFAATDANLEWALDLEADRMVNSFIAKKDLDSEFSVVRNEMESGQNNAFAVLYEKVMATAFQWHNYGKTTIGARSDVENVPIDRLQAFYKTYYQPDNAVLVVAGKIDEAKTLNLINQKFGVIPRPDRVLPKIYTVEPAQDGERQVTVRRVGDTQFVMAGYHVAPAANPDNAAVFIANRILGDAPSGRLYKALVETKKATSVFVMGGGQRDPGFVTFGAELSKEASMDAAREALIETVESFAKTPPTKEEVERHKLTAQKNFELSYNDPNSVGLQLTSTIAQGDWRLLFINRDRTQKVTPEDVQRVAQKYFKQQNRTVGMFQPTAKPDRVEIATISDAEIAALVKDYKGNAIVAAGEAFDPTPANIETRTKRMNLGGLKVALLPKENRGDAVVMRLNFRFGDVKSLMNRSNAGSLAGSMLMRGTTKRDRQQIKDELDRLKARGSVSGGASSVGATMETTRQNLPEVLKLVAEILREPAFSPAEFEQLKQEMITNLESGRSEPTSIVFNAMNQHFNRYPKGDVRYSPNTEEQIANIKALTLDDVKNFHKEFYGGSNGELAFVGDFDEAQIVPLVKELFGNWKSPKAYERIPSEFFDISATNKSFEAPDKANAYFFARLNINIRDDNPDYPALVLGNYILGGGFLNSRLATRIRQKEGISYGVGSGFGANALDPVGTFTASAIYAPQNVERLEAAFKEEVQKVINEGFTKEEIEQAKTGILLSRQRNRGQDNGLALTLASYLFTNRTFAWDAELDNKLQSLTPEQVQAAMKKYITPDKISIFKAGDFAKAKTAAPKE
ncbi:MAG: insulinase family protein [Acidobacteriota bacterium]|nr:insulinase family protein [Acidobacteriota bacterium]